MGIGLVIPRTVVAMLAFKLYIGNKWVKSKISKLIGINEELVVVECGKKSTDFIMERISTNRITWTE